MALEHHEQVTAGKLLENLSLPVVGDETQYRASAGSMIIEHREKNAAERALPKMRMPVSANSTQ